MKNIAAGILPICYSTGRILLCKRGRNQDHPLTWASWGGGFDDEKDTTPKDCAKREFWEETRCGKKYVISKDPINIHDTSFLKFYLYVGVFESEFIPDIISEKEAASWGWFSLDELPENVMEPMEIFFDHKKNQLKKIVEKFKNKSYGRNKRPEISL